MSVRIFNDVASRKITPEEGAQLLLDERKRDLWWARAALWVWFEVVCAFGRAIDWAFRKD